MPSLSSIPTPITARSINIPSYSSGTFPCSCPRRKRDEALPLSSGENRRRRSQRIRSHREWRERRACNRRTRTRPMELLDGADAIIMGAPTYMGSLSAPFKAFMDATSHLQYAEKRWEGKIAAGFTNGASRGGDKQNSLVQLMTFAAQHQMHWVNLGMNYGNNRSYTNEDILNRDSYTLGMAGQADMDQSGDVAPPSSDLRTAEFLGRRVAEVAQELSAGRAMLGRPANRGVSGGADNQDPEGRGVVASGTNQGTARLV